ncbi:MAG: bifunctional riboflavin kinase/FAD synthetase [Gammaproteobacteria bacterium]|nr:bifunctional riboflavin kinase/FAD synthetase [Gammaproteobacteria bacterium]
MELIRGLRNIKPYHHGCVATIGNFDGVHLGHQAVIRQVMGKARELKLPVVVITFEPQPQEYFRPDDVPSRLTRLREKLDVFKDLQVDRVLCLRFDRHLANLTADQFVQQILVDGLGVKYLVVGDDFKFGKDRSGDFAYLQSAAPELGFEVSDTGSLNFAGGRVSSTRIRIALESGDLLLAKQMLGRDYGMCGRVAHGDKRGRTIGFPTANIYLHRKSCALYGVYCVQLHSKHPQIGGRVLNGVANVGQRPTVGGARTLLEVHLFDFDGDIYGAHIQVAFMQKIRDEKRFESFDALKAQIARDVAQAKAFFASP